jgi:D-beta-D-heptose 7-phosphate kinase/D-beta-D-heptose 1-phosphate adenosyltransferase
VTGFIPISLNRARDLIERFARLKVCVVGDVMLDRFVVGRVTRISPEAPVPVVRFEREYSRLGGAANVAQNLAALGAQVSLVGVIGRDDAASRLRALLGDGRIAAEGLVADGSRPTVEKVRIVTDRNQQVARIDYERDSDVDAQVERQLVERLNAASQGADALLVSDYLKGTITRQVVDALLRFKSAASPLVVDPKIPHIDCYAGATLVTPNHYEAEAATHRRIRSDEDARVAAQEFRERVRCESALVTRGEQGMWLSSADAEGGIPAAAREVSDVTGAGDTVVATVALAMAAGATLPEAAMLANHAAGVVVGRFGPATVTAEELISTIKNLELGIWN